MHDQLIDSSADEQQVEYENEHVLVTFSSKLGHEAADQLAQVFTRQCPQLNIQLRRHHQNSSYALDCSLLEADDADDDRPIHSNQQPESAADRLVQVKKLLENAVTDQDLELDFDPTNATNRLHIASGIPLVRQLQSKSPRLIRSLIPLHQPAMLKRLQRRWVFVSPLRLLSPPIGQIGAYFGLEIGLYFAWLAHFTGWLCAPALIGCLLFLLPSSDDNGVELAKFLLFALFNSAWAIAFLRSWERRQQELTASESEEKREKERGQEEKSTLLEQLEQKTAAFGLPSAAGLGSVRLRLDFWRPADALSLSALSAMLLALLRLQDWTKAEFGAGWTSTAPVILQGLVCIGAETFYRRIATGAEAADSRCANGKDSSSSDVDDDRTLIYRLALFQSISAFCPLFYIAFWLGDWPRLQETLATLLITRQFVQNFTEIGVPLVLGRLRMLQLAFVGNRAARRRASSWQVGDEEQELVDGSAGGKSSAERQAALSEYGRPVDDYLEIFVQLGYVLLFSPAFPLAALCALCNNLLEARVDAFKLCAVHRRPWPRAAQPTQEAWQSAIKLMCLAGVSTNLALVLLRCLVAAENIKG